MDLREKKTKRSIRQAFLQLRRKKPLERITVKELSELAEISKATFYLHYKDIYDLSEHLEEEVIRSIIAGIEHPAYCLTDSQAFVREMYRAFYAEQELIATLFSDSRNQILPMRMETELKAFVKTHNPGLDKNGEMLLTYTVYGGYNVYQKYYKDCHPDDILRMIGEATAFALRVHS